MRCYHCGDLCGRDAIYFDDKNFCCNGCKTVYQIFSEHKLTSYYDVDSPGAMPKDVVGRFDFLDDKDIQDKLLLFNEETTAVVNLYVPHIHCSSCIWVLENLHKIHGSIHTAQVNFPEKTVRINFDPNEISLKKVVLLLCKIGYEPYISLDDYNDNKKTVDRRLLYQLGVAGFAFGNVMLLSFPEYFEKQEFWLDTYKVTFRLMMFVFSLPVVFYAGIDYFVVAIKGLRSRFLTIDVPIALGIFVLFLRSSIDVFFDFGSGYFDSLTGLVFFLLLGKFFQQKTYGYLSFERDYKSYFPIAVTKLVNGVEENIQIQKILKGDRILIRSQEIIPVDGILIKGDAQIDYSFVTGESVPIKKKSGDKLFAGGKQLSGIIEIQVLKSVEQSYLTQLWSDSVFSKDKVSNFKTLTDRISRKFTVVVLSIALGSSLFWFCKEFFLQESFSFQNSRVLHVFTSVLIIACPCAIALAAPFTLGNLLRIFGKHKFYLKNATVIEQLAKIDSVVFDKTGTLTDTKKAVISYEGETLSSEDKSIVAEMLHSSNHPLSRNLYRYLCSGGAGDVLPVFDDLTEYVAKGIVATIGDTKIYVGSSELVGVKDETVSTAVHVRFNDSYKGRFIFENSYRKDVFNIFKALNYCGLSVVSGDNEGEKKYLSGKLPPRTVLAFNQKPQDKLKFVARLQGQRQNVMMIGDGLNDAGALAQSNVGIALSESTNVFSPACDGILDATQFALLPSFIKASKKAIQVIKYCFAGSLLYNMVGLYFAVTGQLEPVIAAVIMPLSSISVVLFTTVMTNRIGRNLL